MAKIEEMLNKVYEELSRELNDETIYCQGKNGVKTIVLFDEPDLIPGEKARYRIGTLTILILRDGVPFLSVDVIPTAPTPPKVIAGLLPVHMITRSMVINRMEKNSIKFDLDELTNKLKLLIVVPDQSEGIKEVQFGDLDEKFRGVINLRSEHSNIQDFAITPIENLISSLNKLLENLD
ncbi:hypothetical protein [Methanobacterium alcaliphilum]|uniref:hypothetical protein n=1 Tax=Methanobacterium alcaliphilum TaxID=392018 RepID=UPI00200AC2CE|nr:hypothetical protein [Methanobacterium alcaliphilum]MCK9151816.1 hypothetical protein [Methanobacterium alcaliphilum]